MTRSADSADSAATQSDRRTVLKPTQREGQHREQPRPEADSGRGVRRVERGEVHVLRLAHQGHALPAAFACPTGTFGLGVASSTAGWTPGRTRPNERHELRRSHIEDRGLQRQASHQLPRPHGRSAARDSMRRSAIARRPRTSSQRCARRPAGAKRSTLTPAGRSPWCVRRTSSPGISSRSSL